MFLLSPSDSFFIIFSFGENRASAAIGEAHSLIVANRVGVGHDSVQRLHAVVVERADRHLRDGGTKAPSPSMGPGNCRRALACEWVVTCPLEDARTCDESSHQHTRVGYARGKVLTAVAKRSSRSEMPATSWDHRWIVRQPPEISMKGSWSWARATATTRSKNVPSQPSSAPKRADQAPETTAAASCPLL